VRGIGVGVGVCALKSAMAPAATNIRFMGR
jgi:hypothetical protein